MTFKAVANFRLPEGDESVPNATIKVPRAMAGSCVAPGTPKTVNPEQKENDVRWVIRIVGALSALACMQANAASTVSPVFEFGIALACWLATMVIIAMVARRKGMSRIVSWGGGFIASLLILAVVVGKPGAPADASAQAAAPSIPEQALQVEQDSNDWYLIGGEITEASIVNPGAMKVACTLEEGGPGRMIDVFQRAGKEHQVQDIEKSGDRVLQVQVVASEGAVRFVRGKVRCERVAAGLNQRVATAEANRQVDLGRYK